MRSHRIVLGVLGLMLLIGTAAEAKTAATVTCTDGTTSKAGHGACSHHGGVAKGDTTSAPAAAPESGAGNAATVTCKDGTTGKAGRGACSHHGGVGSAGSAASAPASTGNAPKASAAQRSSAPAGGTSAGDAAGATAKCKDGTYSHSKHHSGTCSGHGGVAQWLDGSGR